MHATSASLLIQLRAQPNGPAWGRFVDLYAPLLHYWVRRGGLQGPDADDLVQEVFVTLLARLPEFEYDPSRKFRSWLRAVASNRLRNWLRGRRRRPEGVGMEGAEPALPDGLEEFWEEEYRQHLTALALKRMQADFEPSTWQACWAVTVEGKTAAEAGKQLGLSVGAVYVARSRVLARLREHLAGMLD